ncbi:hypothetical protein CDO22_22805 (plasmid) [Sinorhizobium meliloti]|nr:hypothetical protein CDO27_18755 [Sinorhizobium meliloti]ASQ02073.1 hypothetical protein CDO24_33280 [Sinorhizobium meliloti]ASQ12827.1 hypothetical protein CDO22_22805 [Sinorhizobium meliloti]
MEIAAETVQNFALLFGLDTFGRGAGHAATGLVKGSGEGTLQSSHSRAGLRAQHRVAADRMPSRRIKRSPVRPPADRAQSPPTQASLPENMTATEGVLSIARVS